jgi:hypothetical protein
VHNAENANPVRSKSNRPLLADLCLPDTLRMLPPNAHLLRLRLLLSELSSLLGNNSLLLSLTSSLGLRTLGIHLLLQDSLTRLLGLCSVDLL